MACQFNKHRFSLIISFLVLFFVIACGAAATPDSEPTADAPEAQTEPAAAPTEAANAAPSGATPTASPQQTPESPQATEPAGTLNIGQKELGPFMGHPRLVGNPQIFLNSASGLTETLLMHNTTDGALEPMLAEEWSISDDFLTWTFKIRQGVQFHKGFGEMLPKMWCGLMSKLP